MRALPRKKIVTSIIFFAFFIVFSVVVRNFDRAAVAGNGTEVGFSELNTGFHSLTAGEGYSSMGHLISVCILALAIGVAIGLVCFCCIHLLRSKGLKNVDKRIWFLLAVYADLLLYYLIFKALRINYGPVIYGEELVPTYPSIYCLVAFVVFGTAIPIIRYYVDKLEVANALVLTFSVLLTLMLVLRCLCGTEWLTDTIGSLLLGTSVLEMFLAGLELTKRLENEED